MRVLLKIRRVGGSLMAAIPSEEAKRLNVNAGDVVSAELKHLPKDMFGVFHGKKIVLTEDDRWHDRD
ncbi:MAG: hypothetical protein Q8P05_02140 [Candidatus Diapherotrites archaeon]|nr:hypothetical protein [Candidatus Diapherotrites archaeon]MDZ4256884.1 hypothetical protein [archaeon]